MLNAFVYIIESPSDFDLLDSRTEGKTLCGALDLASIKHSYSLVSSKKAFVEAINNRLLRYWQEHNVSPILHFSMHGNDQGIELTNGDFIQWYQLSQLLAPLNDAMQGGLLICMSSCFGASGCRMAMHEEDHFPFWALIGNEVSANWTDAAVAYVTFYHQFFKETSIEDCVKKMCIASGDSIFKVYLGHSINKNWKDLMNKNRQENIIAALRQS